MEASPGTVVFVLSTVPLFDVEVVKLRQTFHLCNLFHLAQQHSPCGGNKSFIEYYIETFTMKCDQHKQSSLLKCNTVISTQCYAKSKWIVCQMNQHRVKLQDKNNNGQSVIGPVWKLCLALDQILPLGWRNASNEAEATLKTCWRINKSVFPSYPLCPCFIVSLPSPLHHPLSLFIFCCLFHFISLFLPSHFLFSFFSVSLLPSYFCYALFVHPLSVYLSLSASLFLPAAYLYVNLLEEECKVCWV